MSRKVQPKVLKAAVLGANDGIITTFAVVAGVVGAGLSVETILILGIANMIADGISMALGDYLGEQSANQLEGKKTNQITSFFHSTSAVTFVAFVLAGSLPLLPYILEYIGLPVALGHQFALSITSTGLALFVVGSLRTIITKHGWLRSGVEMLLVGTFAALCAYFIGAFIEKIIS